MSTTMESPLPDAYWVVDGLLLAGRYAGDYDDGAARERIAELLEAGIRVFIDLTEAGELRTYEHLLSEEAHTRNVPVEYQRVSVRDLDVPTTEDLAGVLSTIDRAIASHRPVYVHCHGGIGRTGTIIGCWLSQNGYPGEAALERIAELRLSCRIAYGRSPETDAQREMVRQWGPGKARPTEHL